MLAHFHLCSYPENVNLMNSVQNLQALSGRLRVVVLAHEDWSFEGQVDCLVF
jgi:hypothetical protein